MMLKRRFAAAVMVAALGGGGLLVGCSNDDGGVSCNLSNCTVTLNRGADATASVLGVEIKLVGVNGDQITVDVGGNQVAVPTGGNEVQAGGLNIRVDKVTDDQVVLKISKA